MHINKKLGLHGEVTIAGDKSISHRALILSSMVLGKTSIYGLLEAEDVLNTAKALRSLGVPIEKTEDGVWEVNGVGIGGLSEPDEVLDMGNSGTGARLLMGLVSSYPFNTFFCGDESLAKRPMNRVIRPIKEMGGNAISRSEGRFPIVVMGEENMIPITYRLPVPSAQVKSAVLLAALNIPGKTTVIEGARTRDHTERMMSDFGIKVDIQEVSGGRNITIEGQQELRAGNREIGISGDPSSAAFLIAAALIVEGSDVIIRNVCMNETRTGFYSTITEMGADINYDNIRDVGGEEVADVMIKHSKLKGVEVPIERVTSMIDEFPILAVIASFAEGKTVMRGLGELKVKESDRLQTIYDGLTACGVKATLEKEGLIVEGGIVEGGATVATHMDHRIAMSFLIMGLASEHPVLVDDISSINTSFPEFFELCRKLGIEV